MVLDTLGADDDYEAQRAANIKANLELMMSLGLYQTSKQLNPTTPKPKPKAKAKPTPSSEADSPRSEEKRERPRRITRSVSRAESPQVPRWGLKRAGSDQGMFARKRRLADDYDPDTFDAESDEEYAPRRRGALNPARHHRDEGELQRRADRLGVRIHDPKTFGAIPGIPVGTLWEKRMDCSTDAVHAPTVAGISGNEVEGCWSICLSGGYEDDVDLGDTFTYTGSGGRDLRGTVNNPKNLRTAPQSSDQKWEGKNAALRKSAQTGRPVRVVRGYKAMNKYAPEEGYVYSGLYRTTHAWMETGKAGFKVCKFRFQRLPNQDPLPTFDQQQEGVESALTSPEPSPSPEPEAEAEASPAPSCASVASVASVGSAASRSRNPLLSTPEFDRAQYIIISDSEDDEDEDDEIEVVLELTVPRNRAKEHISPRKRRSSRLPPMRKKYTR